MELTLAYFRKNWEHHFACDKNIQIQKLHMNYSLKKSKADNSLATNASICDTARNLLDNFGNLFNLYFKIFYTSMDTSFSHVS